MPRTHRIVPGQDSIYYHLDCPKNFHFGKGNRGAAVTNDAGHRRSHGLQDAVIRRSGSVPPSDPTARHGEASEGIEPARDSASPQRQGSLDPSTTCKSDSHGTPGRSRSSPNRTETQCRAHSHDSTPHAPELFPVPEIGSDRIDAHAPQGRESRKLIWPRSTGWTSPSPPRSRAASNPIGYHWVALSRHGELRLEPDRERDRAAQRVRRER